ncbi:MAG TPA: arginine--tRNA ligase [Candidatus Merdicola faecigallinarum]|uniref:Arginine--tRNA ligase n=1 Tax=Candidatus Merdicola faecigallinarum TaxID=2840862 RepID=A0A9D1S9Q9_9FIRM|nr:arginine--tRNA ligase [Candidatus Merdicola faecigallinarum]
MLDLKKEIAKMLANAIEYEEKELEEYIEIPKDTKMGDYAFPCFRLAKELKKSPIMIANDIKEKIKVDENIIEKIEVVNGYLNIYVNKETLVKEVLKQTYEQKEKYGSSEEGKGKNVIVEYSSPNIAKPFHIGHLRSTVIGNALYHLYQFLGYNVVGINHLGDWGTQFGKMIEGYKRWGKEYTIDENPIDELTKIYVRINNLCKEDETVLEECRLNFKKLEDGDPYCREVWQKFRDLSLKEFQRIYDMLGVKFDSMNGEAFYSDKMPEIIDILDNKGKTQRSQGAKIIDLEDKGMPPLILEKSNESTTYATRDLAAILYRSRTYDFDKCLYIVAYEQNLHFKQVFEVAKMLGIDEKYTKGLIHVPFGMIRSKNGKMSTREGTIIKLEEILLEAIERAKQIIEEKNPELEEKEEVAKKVGIGAVIFNDLYNNRIKDEIFDWDTMLNFQGETGPYLQYIYVRTNSILEKINYKPEIENIDINQLTNENSIGILKLVYTFHDIIKQAVQKNEPSILSRYLIELAQKYSSFYNDNKILIEEEKVQNARLYLTYIVGQTLKTGAGLLGIEMPNKM